MRAPAFLDSRAPPRLFGCRERPPQPLLGLLPTCTPRIPPGATDRQRQRMAAAKTPRVQLVLRVQGEERAAEPQLRVLQATAGAGAAGGPPPLPLNRSCRLLRRLLPCMIAGMCSAILLTCSPTLPVAGHEVAEGRAGGVAFQFKRRKVEAAAPPAPTASRLPAPPSHLLRTPGAALTTAAAAATAAPSPFADDVWVPRQLGERLLAGVAALPERAPPAQRLLAFAASLGEAAVAGAGPRAAALAGAYAAFQVSGQLCVC